MAENRFLRNEGSSFLEIRISDGSSFTIGIERHEVKIERVGETGPDARSAFCIFLAGDTARAFGTIW